MAEKPEVSKVFGTKTGMLIKDYNAVIRDLKAVGRVRLTSAGSVLQCLGQLLPADKPQLAGKLSQPGNLLRLPDRHRQVDLHDQHYRVFEQLDPVCHQKTQGIGSRPLT